MKRAATLLALVSSVVGCRADGEAPDVAGASTESVGDARHVDECDWLSTPAPGDPNLPLCDLEFREIVHLVGSIEGVAPNRPVQVLRDGTYVTGTYSRGRIAHWGPDGQLLNVFGTGPGEGPGEFDYATEFAQASDDEFFVFTGLVHKYSMAEGFVRSFRLPTLGGVAAAAAYEDGVVVAAHDVDGIRGFRLRGDSVQPQGVLAPTGAGLLLAAVEGVGVWSATSDRYVLRRHMWPGGTVVDSLVVNRDWFRGPEGREALLYGLQADGRGLIWAAGMGPDPDAPPRRPAAGVEVPITEEDEADAIRYTDFVIDAFTPDGRLVASVRFDTLEETPRPMPGGLWFRPTEDGLSVVILEALLVPRE